MKKWIAMKKWIGAIVLLSVLTLAGCGSSSSNGGGDTGMGDGASFEGVSGAASALAVIDGESGNDEAAVADRQYALDAVIAKCPGLGESRAGDMATVAKQRIEDAGASASTLDVLEGVDMSIPGEMVGSVRCIDMFAAYVTLVKSGEGP